MKNISNISVQERPAQTRAFTLIELLVVIAIIALLTGIVMTNLVGSKAKARDAKRVADLGQIQMALELYYDRCKQYPNPRTGSMPVLTDNIGCPSGITFGTYISQIPTAPGGAEPYEYYGFASGSRYVLRANLESKNPALLDDIDGANGGLDLGAINGMGWSTVVKCGDNNENNSQVGGTVGINYCLVSN